MLASEVYTQQPVLDVGAKISAIDASDRYIFIGTLTGDVNRYLYDTNKGSNIAQEQSKKTINLGKIKVENIKCIPVLSCVLVQTSDGVLYQIDEQSLAKPSEPITKSCHSFCLNESSKIIGELLVFSSSKPKNQLMLFRYNNKSGRFEIVDADQKLPDAPAALAWYKRTVLVGYKGRSYDRIIQDDKSIQTIHQEQVPQRPLIKIINDDEFIILMNPDTGMSFSLKTFDPLPKSTIQISNKFVGVTVVHPYIIILYDNLIQIYNVNIARNKGRLLQEISLSKDVGKGLSSTSSNIFFATTSSVYYLSLLPYYNQIYKCFYMGKVDDAQLVFDQHVTEYDPDRAKKLEQFRVDATWVLIRDLNFKYAKTMLENTAFDFKEFLALFRDYLPRGVEILKEVNSMTSGSKRYSTISLVIEEAIKSQRVAPDLKQDPSKTKKIAKEFLIYVLENCRAYYLSNFEDNLNEVPKHTTSQFSFFAEDARQGRINQFSVREMLEMIDFALIRLFAEFKMENQLSQFLDNNKIYCKTAFSDLESFVLELRNLNPKIVARFYEQFGKLEKALELWRDLGNSVESKSADLACEQTIRILKTSKDPKLIIEYLQWVLTRMPKIGMRMFNVLDEKVIRPDIFLEYLDKLPNAENKRELKERFLEVLVLENKVEDEKYHTILAKHYVQQLFEIRPKDMVDDDVFKKDKRLAQNMKKFTDYMKKFTEFLENPNTKYRADTILQEIKDSWLVDNEIYLYGKEKQHDKALVKLVHSHHFLEAEKYCASKSEGLLTKLFKIYIDLYRDTEKEMKRDKNYEEALVTLRILIETFMKKYASHPQLDALAVLELIPEDWVISNKEENNGLFIFLSASLSNALHQKRKMKIAKQVSEMDLLNVECLNAKSQLAHVKITQDKSCSVCQKKIGDKVFVVYPNGVTAHHTCRADNNLNICPVTKQNFEKSFQG